jgi:hypothetical protein
LWRAAAAAVPLPYWIILNVKWEEELVSAEAVCTAVDTLSSPKLTLSSLAIDICVDDDVEP